jgi:hypothetical protein
MRIQLLRHDHVYHVDGTHELVHNHDLLLPKPGDIPEDLEAIRRELIQVDVEKAQILDYIYRWAGCLFRRFHLAALDLGELRLALGTEIDGLLEYMQSARWAENADDFEAIREDGIR